MNNFSNLWWKKISLFSGQGGKGAIAFDRISRQKGNGPSGGDGGDGGSIIFCVDTKIQTLEHLKQGVIYGKNGTNGSVNKQNGKHGKPTYLYVPNNTYVVDETFVVLSQLNQNNLEYVALSGGDGGKGNFHLKRKANLLPHFFEYGEPPKKLVVFLIVPQIIDICVFANNLKIMPKITFEENKSTYNHFSLVSLKFFYKNNLSIGFTKIPDVNLFWFAKQIVFMIDCQEHNQKELDNLHFFINHCYENHLLPIINFVFFEDKQDQVKNRYQKLFTKFDQVRYIPFSSGNHIILKPSKRDLVLMNYKSLFKIKVYKLQNPIILVNSKKNKITLHCSFLTNLLHKLNPTTFEIANEINYRLKQQKIDKFFKNKLTPPFLLEDKITSIKWWWNEPL